MDKNVINVVSANLFCRYLIPYQDQTESKLTKAKDIHKNKTPKQQLEYLKQQLQIENITLKNAGNYGKHNLRTITVIQNTFSQHRMSSNMFYANKLLHLFR